MNRFFCAEESCELTSLSISSFSVPILNEPPGIETISRVTPLPKSSLKSSASLGFLVVIFPWEFTVTTSNLNFGRVIGLGLGEELKT